MHESRLFQIVYYLLDRGHATAPELAAKFEVSIRTIYRDVDAISSAGIPVFVTTGRNGGIHILDHFVLDKTMFSEHEKQELLSSLQSLAAAQFPNIEAILHKLGACFQMNLTDWIDVDFSRWGTVAEHENQMFRKLKQAIFERRQIQFIYFNSSGECMAREVRPHKMAYKDRAWYLFGFCLMKNDYRLFRLTRIKNLVLTDTHFESGPEPGAAIFPQAQDMGPLLEMELDFTSDAGYRLFDTLGDAAITQHENGYHVRVTLPENEWLYEFLLSFGDRVTIKSPRSLRETILNQHKAALDHHKGELL